MAKAISKNQVSDPGPSWPSCFSIISNCLEFVEPHFLIHLQVISIAVSLKTGVNCHYADTQYEFENAEIDFYFLADSIMALHRSKYWVGISINEGLNE